MFQKRVVKLMTVNFFRRYLLLYNVLAAILRISTIGSNIPLSFRCSIGVLVLKQFIVQFLTVIVL